MMFLTILSMFAAVGVATGQASTTSTPRPNRRALKIFEYWTPERIASAVPRDFVLDPVSGERHLRTRSLQSTVADEDWTGGGAVNEAAGRIIFSFGSGNYVCSGTVIKDYGTVGRSLVLTAAHCAYDEVNDVHATNVMFIPKQDDGGLDGSNFDCSDDNYGCWLVPLLERTPSSMTFTDTIFEAHHHTSFLFAFNRTMQLGVVDSRWRDGDWPSIIKHDYAIYVVPDSGGWFTPGYNNSNPVLDSVVGGGLEVDFTNEQGKKQAWTVRVECESVVSSEFFANSHGVLVCLYLNRPCSWIWGRRLPHGILMDQGPQLPILLRYFAIKT
jgi:hypothetical protein